MPVHDWTRVDPGIFHDFHLEWIHSIKAVLNSGILPPDYYALAEQIAGGLQPDVLTLESVRRLSPEGGGNGSAAPPRSGEPGIAVADNPPQVRFTAEFEAEAYARKRKRISIRHRSGDDVVAMVEIVSSGNKASRHALRSFVDKATELLDADIHLLILDLFPPSVRDPQGIHGAISARYEEECPFQLPDGMPLTLVAYAAGAGVRAYVEPTAVGRDLPVMPLFLTPTRYVSVPLKATYQTAFEAVPRRWREVLES